MTDSEKILAAIDALANELNESRKDIDSLAARLDNHANGINAIGQNLNWLVENVKGIFDMFRNPMLMQQVMGMFGDKNEKGEDNA